MGRRVLRATQVRQNGYAQRRSQYFESRLQDPVPARRICAASWVEGRGEPALKVIVQGTGETAEFLGTASAEEFLDGLASRGEGVIELLIRGELFKGEEVLTVGVHRSFGFAIWHPPAVAGSVSMSTRGGEGEGEPLSFDCGTDERVHIPREYLVPKAELAEVVAYFAATGGMRPATTWEPE